MGWRKSRKTETVNVTANFESIGVVNSSQQKKVKPNRNKLVHEVKIYFLV